MVQTLLTKGEHDGFNFYFPKDIFYKTFNSDYAVAYASEYAFYKKDIFEKIEASYALIKQTQSRFVSNNTKLVDEEILYTGKEDGVLISCKLHWEYDDYHIIENDDEQIPDELSNGTPQNLDERLQISISMYCLENKESHKEFFQNIISTDRTPLKKERELNIICANNQEGIHFKQVKTLNVNIEIEDNYNDDFLEVSNNIIKRLNNKADNGIVLLHSEPGCGKTSYLRYLTQRIDKKRIIYMPPDMALRLADPEFMAFFMDYPDSILLIEDAENALMSVDGRRNPAVSNLLNSSDGLLGDALRIQIVCTFNCKLEDIDEALLRPGRLIAEYRFEKLTEVKTRNLIVKEFGEDSEYLKNIKPMTLAQIYGLNTKQHKSEVKQIRTIGFSVNR